MSWDVCPVSGESLLQYYIHWSLQIENPSVYNLEANLALMKLWDWSPLAERNLLWYFFKVTNSILVDLIST